MEKSCRDCESTSLDLNCMVVGDPGVGKTMLCVSYADNDFSSDHIPTEYAVHPVLVDAEGSPVRFLIHDFGGSNELAPSRLLKYTQMHVILLCFSVVKPQSLWNLKRHWLPEISQKIELNLAVAQTARKKHKSSSKNDNRKQARNGPAIILVGCKCDLRSDISYILELAKQNEEPIDERIAKCLASELGAEVYIECSSLTQKLLKKVFDLAIWFGMQAYRSVNANITSNNRNLAVSSNNHVDLSSPGTTRNGNIPCSSKRQHKVARSSSSEVNSKCYCL